MSGTTQREDALRMPAGRPQSGKPAVHRHPPLDSVAILRGQTAVEISHNGVLYRLQATRLGKLILTK